MNKPSTPQLHQVRGVIEGLTFSGLKTATEVAPHVRMVPRRLQELSDAQILPHFRIDGGEPLFQMQNLKQFIRRHLTTEFVGAPVPLNLRPIVFQRMAEPPPLPLAAVQDRLCEYPSCDLPPCVYFLISDSAVTYVGQSRNLSVRLAQHRQNGKSWDKVLYMPVLECDLLRVETEWIAALNPSLNRAGAKRGESQTD